MTAARHRAAATAIRARYRTARKGLMPSSVGSWGYEIWPALAAEHDRRAAQIDLALATTAEMTAVVDAITTTDQRSTP